MRLNINTCYGIKIGNQQIHNLRFTDDTILVAKDPDKLQMMLQDLHSLTYHVGLKISKSKTKIMVKKFTRTPTITLSNQAFEVVKNLF